MLAPHPHAFLARLEDDDLEYDDERQLIREDLASDADELARANESGWAYDDEDGDDSVDGDDDVDDDWDDSEDED